MHSCSYNTRLFGLTLAPITVSFCFDGNPVDLRCHFLEQATTKNKDNNKQLTINQSSACPPHTKPQTNHCHYLQYHHTMSSKEDKAKGRVLLPTNVIPVR